MRDCELLVRCAVHCLCLLPYLYLLLASLGGSVVTSTHLSGGLDGKHHLRLTDSFSELTVSFVQRIPTTGNRQLTTKSTLPCNIQSGG